MTYKENQILLGHHPDAGYPIILEIVGKTMGGCNICNLYMPDFNSWVKMIAWGDWTVDSWVKDTKPIFISKQKKDFLIYLWASK